MKTAKVKFNVENNFEPGDCVDCPLNVIDWSNAEDGFPSHCQLDFDWDKCPIVLEGKGRVKRLLLALWT